jgi:hypothetical protein
MDVNKTRRWVFRGFVSSLFVAGIFMAGTLFNYSFRIQEDQLPGGHTSFHAGFVRQVWFEYAIIKGDPRSLRSSQLGRFPFIGWVIYPPSPPRAGLTIIGADNWIVSLPFLVLACWFWDRYCRVTKTKSGLCPICGYDLRAHEPGQKCPECGTEIPRFGWRSPKD